jgi:catechol 2,3-dioxygenase-like lactoylglutathione lyase family enzyme
MPYRGPGLYHIGVRVDSADAEVARLRAAGVELLDTEPREGDSMRVAFLAPSAGEGVMVELVEHIDRSRKR